MATQPTWFQMRKKHIVLHLCTLAAACTSTQNADTEVANIVGKADGVDIAAAPVVIEAPVSGQRFGFGLAGLGDLDGDGANELAVGSPGPSYGTFEFAGRVDIYDGATFERIDTLVGPKPGSGFGHAIARLPDIDDDGIDDFVVGVPWSASAMVFSGVDRKLLFKTSGPSTVGFSVASVGDVDGDGVGDVAMGGPWTDDWCGMSLGSTGAVVVASGASGETIRLFEGFKFDWLGYSVAGTGDTNGDGHADIVAGSTYEVWGSIYAGSVVVLDGAVVEQACEYGEWDALHVHRGDVGDELGFSVTAIDDVDGDSVDDILAGAPGGAVSRSRARVVSGATGQLVASLRGEKDDFYFGRDVLRLPDIDGDAVGDFAVSEPGPTWWPGKVHVYSGANREVLFRLSGGGFTLAAVNGPDPCPRLATANGDMGAFSWTGKVHVHQLPCEVTPE